MNRLSPENKDRWFGRFMNIEGNRWGMTAVKNIKTGTSSAAKSSAVNAMAHLKGKKSTLISLMRKSNGAVRTTLRTVRCAK